MRRFTWWAMKNNSIEQATHHYLFTYFVVYRKSTTTKCRTRISAWLLNRTSQFRNKERMKSAKFRRPSSSQDVRKPSSQRWLSNRTSRKRSSRASRSSKRIVWRIRLWTNRSDWPRWKLKKTAKDACSRCRGRLTIVWTMRNTFASKKRKKSCKWKSSRWSSSRSCRILKPCRRMPTRS